MQMKRLFFTACISASWAICQAQDLKQTTYYMGLPNVSKAAKDIHSGVVRPTDDAVMASIADSMFTENEDTRPFYIFLVSKTLYNTQNKSLKLMLGAACRRCLQNYPNGALELLFSKSVKPVYKEAWAAAIANDIDGNCEGASLKDCYKQSRMLALEVCKTDNKDKLEIVYNLIRTRLNIGFR